MLRDEIVAAMRNADELSAAEARELYDSVDARFAVPGGRPLWERLRSRASRQHPEGWLTITQFVRGQVILLIEDTHGPYAVRLASPADLQFLLENTFRFEFYVMDDELTYLLAFNHHDFLIGAGTAEAWVRTLAG